MKKITPLLIILLQLLSVSAIEIPPGGSNMTDDALTSFSRVGNAATMKVVDVEHEQFSKAIEVNVTAKTANYWDVQLVLKTNSALEEGDVCLVSFWARTTKSGSEAGEGLLTAIIEHRDTYVKPLSKTFAPGGEWAHYVYGFKSDMTLTADKHRAAFFLGYGIQTIQLAEIQFLNYKNTLSLSDLPVMEVRYAGMEADAPWRVEAGERIEKYRKGNVTVRLADAQNNPVAGAQVTLRMKQHLFGFGSAIDGKFYLSNATYRNHIHELFNEVVFENDLKWRPWVSRSSHNYILQAIDSLAARNFRVRGHTLIWPGWNYLPDYLRIYEDNAERLRLETMDRIDEAAGFTKGRLVDWDVLNEPYTNRDLQNVTGDEIMADWFRRTKEVDPGVKRYINDYSILGNGGVNTSHQDGYFDIIRYIDEHGGDIDGIGMQGHFAELVTGIPRVFEILDRFAALNKEIKITEFDINSINDELKVNYTRDFMTALFSYPHVKSILCWGFWAGRHWKPEAAYYNLDWTIRPQGEMYSKLVFEEWWTPEQTLGTDASGNAVFGNCFLGNYEVEVNYNGTSFVKTVPVHYNLENEITVNVEDASVTTDGSWHADTPLLTAAESYRNSRSDRMKVYPNPAVDRLNIEFSGRLQGNVSVTVTSSTGTAVLSRSVNASSKHSIELPGLKPGLYFISAEAGTRRFTGKFMVK